MNEPVQIKQSLSSFEWCLIFSLPIIIHIVLLIFMWDAISLIIMMVVMLPLLIAMICFIIAKLIVEISSSQITYYIWPFTSKKVIKRVDIASVEIYRLNAIKEFGGWGIRRNYKSKATGYIFNGKYCLYITLNNGSKIAISIKDYPTAKHIFQDNGYISVNSTLNEFK